jgi:hypothetical protein
MCQMFEKEIWVKDNFGSVNLKDKRLNSRLEKVVKKIAGKPEVGLPAQMETWAEVSGCYRMLNNKKVTHKRVQSAHITKTRKDAAKVGDKVILFPQDGSEIEVQKTTNGAGPIGNHTCRGIMMHNCLAVVYDEINPQVLGLANQRIWERDDVVLHKSETRAERNKRSGKESEHWFKTIKSIGTPPEEATWVSIGDRGNDIYEFLQGVKQSKWHAVVRASQDRLVEVKGRQMLLMEYVKTILIGGTTTVRIRRQGDSKPIDVEMSVSWNKIRVSPPQRITGDPEPITLWVVRCFNREEDLEWVLYSTIPVRNLEEAIEKIKWYACRWIIEEYHKCLKTGCRIESNQFEDIKPVEALLGILSVVSILMLQMKYLARNDDQTLAKTVVPKIVLTIICKRYGLDKMNITIKAFWRAVAQLGGFLGRKSDGDPGWQTLWKGWLRLVDMWIGAEALMDM